MFYNTDFVHDELENLENTADLIIADPPFGIEEQNFDSMYNRKKENVISEGYNNIHIDEYEAFTHKWIRQAERVLKDHGSMYIVSGWTNLRHILNALNLSLSLKVQNHIIWKYNFGVWTTKKYVTSHYHILYCVPKTSKNVIFNLESRFENKRTKTLGNLNYADREDVWHIKREYRPNQKKYTNQLPTELVKKMIQYSSNPGDMVFDPFLGSFTTAICAKELGRRCSGFEINPTIFKEGMKLCN